MSQEELIRKLTDYVLLNAYSVNSTGLYNVKAGLSLSFFVVARLLNDNCCILHLHTLNLIDLAVYIRGQVGCKIIAYLHCILGRDCTIPILLSSTNYMRSFIQKMTLERMMQQTVVTYQNVTGGKCNE